jgi:hypothetical protein
LKLQEETARGTQALKEAELSLKQQQEEFREREAALLIAHENLAKLIEQLQVRV